MDHEAQMKTGGRESALKAQHQPCTCQRENNSGVSWHGRQSDEGHANAFCSCMNTNEEHIKSHFPALYKTPSAPSWANVNTHFQSGGILSTQSVNRTLPAETDCPLPPFLSSQPRLRALSSARQTSVPTFSARLEVHPCRMFPCSTVKKETAGCSHWGTMSARGLGLRKQQIQKCQLLIPLKATQCQLSSCSRSCLSCNMGAPHYTAMAQQWQHRPLEQRKEFQGLILLMLFWWVTRTSVTSHCWKLHSSSLPLLQGYA